MDHENITHFHSLKTLTALNSHTNQAALTAHTKTEEFYKRVLEQMFFWLGEIKFGTDMIGENAYYYLKRLIWDYRVNPNQRIKE